ncbi:hypothetical protein NMY22_g18333 [Coprinellus aureogranulatus]|nr:hypothetical protein NMY22_g18333 [Coprinellus aureogranulatus]
MTGRRCYAAPPKQMITGLCYWDSTAPSSPSRSKPSTQTNRLFPLNAYPPSHIRPTSSPILRSSAIEYMEEDQCSSESIRWVPQVVRVPANSHRRRSLTRTRPVVLLVSLDRIALQAFQRISALNAYTSTRRSQTCLCICNARHQASFPSLHRRLVLLRHCPPRRALWHLVRQSNFTLVAVGDCLLITMWIFAGVGGHSSGQVRYVRCRRGSPGRFPPERLYMATSLLGGDRVDLFIWEVGTRGSGLDVVSGTHSRPISHRSRSVTNSNTPYEPTKLALPLPRGVRIHFPIVHAVLLLNRTSNWALSPLSFSRKRIRGREGSGDAPSPSSQRSTDADTYSRLDSMA